MNEMVERVARAMVANLQSDDQRPGLIMPSDPLDCMMIDGSVNMLSLARAAIAAMQEPTEAMLTAGDLAVGYNDYDGAVGACWKAMLAAALAESLPNRPDNA